MRVHRITTGKDARDVRSRRTRRDLEVARGVHVEHAAKQTGVGLVADRHEERAHREL